MKKIWKFLAVALSAVCCLGVFAKITNTSIIGHNKKTEQAQEQENPTETNKYHAGAVLTFGEIPQMQDSFFEANISFHSANKGGTSDTYIAFKTNNSGGYVIAGKYTDSSEFSVGIYYGSAWRDESGDESTPDVWTLVEDIPDDEDHATLRAWLDANVTVS